MASAKAILYAIAAALCYGISVPASKILLEKIPPTFMAAALYIGAGLGMLLINIFKKDGNQYEAKISNHELPYTIAMIVLDIAAPALLLLGLTMTNSATVSLLNNFEIAATTVIALVFFREAVGARMWLAISFIAVASIVLSVDDFTKLSFSSGSLFVLLACVCWGIENNCTRILSLKDPLQIVIIKGIGSGSGALILALMLRETIPAMQYFAVALLLGFVAYGLSITFYILAQRTLGAVRTSVYYSFAPFIGVALSFAAFRESQGASFLIALLVMIIGTYFAVSEKHRHVHIHQIVKHEHRHNHADGHHEHIHDALIDGEHSHLHIHESTEHIHAHTPDLHHVHAH